MKFFRLFTILCCLTAAALAQNVLPNLSYSGYLNAPCTNANTACSGAIFVTGMGSTGQSTSYGFGSALDVPVANYAAATITVSGTYAGATINFEFSDPTGGTNYFQEVCARTDINLLEISEILPSNQVRAWNCPVWAATRFRVRLSAYSSGAVNVNVTLTQASIDPSLVVAASITNIAGASDPCQDVSALKVSAVVNISTATTTQIVPVSGSTIVYVCGYSLQTVSGTTPTLYFEYGTGGSCTGTTALTGTFTGAALQTFTYGPGETIMKTPASNGLCIVSAGTTPNIQGIVTYVQQ
jgi:hypothetical protein